ncbi:MAG TPA: hypothetical protein V6D00_15805 [Pantanalinema sp.]
MTWDEVALLCESVDFEAKAAQGIDGRRLHEMSELHSRDLTVRLQGLVRRNFLVPEGGLRNRSYRLPEGSLPYPVGPLFGQVGEEQVEGSVQSEELQAIVAPLHGLRRFPTLRMEQIILRLCAIRPLTLKQLSILLERSPETIRTHFLNPMVQQGRLLLEYPDKPSHPDQAYRSKPGGV